MSAKRRFPDRVYGVGEEPDPRFSLANERTFLAWVRTGLGFLAGAAALEALRLPTHGTVQRLLSAALALAALTCGVQAWVGWMRTERAMRTGEPLPGAQLALPLVVLVGVLALVLLVLSALG